uniref:Cytochrome b5 heme-binding domain-containing protein n=1 Tax=Photinus pyralis TaxID=7054 RepID=A0A1Y1MCK6_PHOPY
MTTVKLALSFTVLVLGLILSIYNHQFVIFLNSILNKSSKTEDLLTPEELKEFNGEANPRLYLAVLGSVYDVSKGRKHYGPGETYNVFVGRDASRSFVTGKFKDAEASDDVIGLTNKELLSLDNWVKFYEKQYTKVGKVIGRYYDTNGQETQYHKQVNDLIRNALSDEEQLKLVAIEFPPCNIEWNADTGTRVWCTKRRCGCVSQSHALISLLRSGGLERSWIGFPRKLYEPGSDSFRCACIKEEDLVRPNIQEYQDCNSNYVSCNVNTANV